MPQTYAQIVTAAADATWKARVKAALITAAVNITVDAPNTALDQQRDRLARAVLSDPDGWTERFNLPVALGFTSDNDLAAANVTDAEIDTRVAAVWNDLIQRG